MENKQHRRRKQLGIELTPPASLNFHLFAASCGKFDPRRLKMKINLLSKLCIISLCHLVTGHAVADSNAELAKQLVNPVASLISVPFQLNYDGNIGPEDKGERITLNIQPVVPFSINENWNVISRTILPIIDLSDIAPSTSDKTGMGDIVQSIFFSPKAPTKSGWIWGAGPVFLLPTASNSLLGSDKWGAGLTGVVLKQTGSWSYGALANHIVSVAGDNDRQDISSTFIQPFLTYTTKDAKTFALNTESTYDWKSNQWAVPVNVTASKVVKVGNQLLSISGGVGYWVENTQTSPDGFRFRLSFTFLFPK